MTDKMIKKTAADKMLKNIDTSVLATLYFFATLMFVLLSEYLIVVIMLQLKTDYRPFDIKYYAESDYAIQLLVLRLIVYFWLMSMVTYLIRRHFINMTDGQDSTDRYTSGHWRKLLLPSVKCSFMMVAYKALVASPLALGVYGIYYFHGLSTRGEIRLAEMVGFMLSIGFTIVWLGELVHYYISLSLVRYIIQINPRANFFDACDLSVMLMEGKHMRIIWFNITMIPQLLLCVLIYPVLLVYPYITECRLLIAKDIMGKYWQDKIPAMARRWEKQMKRSKYASKNQI